MDIRHITDTYYVAPQIAPADMAELAAAGFGTVICNRPDTEVSPELQSDAMRQAAEAAGLSFHAVPLTHQTFTPENVARHASHAETGTAKVLAYCASGTRSTIAWALGQAGHMPVDDILSAARAAGYDLENLRPTLEAAAKAR